MAVLGVGSQFVDYAENDPISGTLYDVNYRHWFLLEDNRVNRRLEVTLKVGKNRTHDDDNAYRVATPGAGLLWRIGDTKATGVLALFAGAGSGGAGPGKWSKSIKSVKKIIGADSLIRSLMAAPEEEQEEE